MKKKNNIPDEDMRKEYDFSGGIRGKYYKKYHQGTNIVALDPDVARIYKQDRIYKNLIDLTCRWS
jgi:hypothetical protein